MIASFLSTQQVAEMLGVRAWQVRRIFEAGDIAEVDRFAGKRAIPSAMIPEVVDALRSHGWLPISASEVQYARS